MPNNTRTLGLIKPLKTERYNVDVFNENADKIDKLYANTIDELKLKTGYAVGDVVEVLGYYEKGDGAGHPRIKKPVGYNGADAVIGVDGSIWGIVHNGEVNVSWFGAKGDGVTDDSEAINKTFDFKSCSTINFGNKTYKASSKLTVKSKKIIGDLNTRINFELKNNIDNCLEVIDNCTLENFDLNFNNTGLDGLVCKGEASNLSIQNINTYNSYRDSFVLDSSSDFAWKENTFIKKICLTDCGRHAYVFRVGGNSTFINETVMLDIEVRRIGNNFENSFPLFFTNTKSNYTSGLKISGLSILGSNFDMGTGVNWGKGIIGLENVRVESLFISGGGYECISAGSTIQGSEFFKEVEGTTNIVEGVNIFGIVHYNLLLGIAEKFKETTLINCPSVKNMPIKLFNSIKTNYDFYYNNNDISIDLTSGSSSKFYPVALRVPKDIVNIIIDNKKTNNFSLDVQTKGNPYNQYGSGNKFFKYQYFVKNYEKIEHISKVDYSVYTDKTFVVLYLKGGYSYSVRQLNNYTTLEECMYNSSDSGLDVYGNLLIPLESVIDSKFKNSHTFDININSVVVNLDTPYYTAKMQERGIYVDYVNYRDELHEYENSKNTTNGIMTLIAIQEPTIPKSVAEFAEEYNLL